MGATSGLCASPVLGAPAAGARHARVGRAAAWPGALHRCRRLLRLDRTLGRCSTPSMPLTATSPSPSATCPTAPPARSRAWCDFVTSRVGAGYPFELVAGNHESNGQNGNINDFSACLPNQLPGRGRHLRPAVLRRRAGGGPDRPVHHDLPGAAFPDGTWSYAAGSARYIWTVDGHRRRPGRLDPVGGGRHAQTVHQRGHVHLRTRGRPVQPAAQQEGRPDSERPRARLPAQPSVGSGAGCAHCDAPEAFDADCVGLRHDASYRARAAWRCRGHRRQSTT